MPQAVAFRVAELDKKRIAAQPSSEALRSQKTGPASKTISSTNQPITLGNAGATVDLNVPSGFGARLKTFAEAPSASEIKSGAIVLEDVELGPAGVSELQNGFRVFIEPSHPKTIDKEPEYIKIGAIKLDISTEQTK
jgi:hypothetical protein